ncbi:MAG: hypothetical protein NT015_05860 [Alphaproteobacteria bacterium]|nr:hypothetical protein [Alphaproteobacteria bacterium]
MSTFEYVSVIFSVVVSLAFTHLLAGIVRLIHARGVKFSFVHAGWIALLVFWCIDYWFRPGTCVKPKCGRLVSSRSCC